MTLAHQTSTFDAEDRQALQSSARELLTRRSGSERVRAATEEGEEQADLWQSITDMGWHALLVPESHGGAGASFAELAVVLEELAADLAVVPLLSTVLASSLIHAAGSPEQQERLLPVITDGSRRAALVAAHPGATGTPPTLSWRAGEPTLDGTVGFVLDGAAADLLVVVANGIAGPAVAVVSASTEGVSARQQPTLDRTRRLSRITFDHVRLDPADVLPGAAAVEHVLQLAAASIAVDCVGGAQRMLDMTVDYVGTRRQFGRPVGSFQAVKHMCADMYVQLEGARVAANRAVTTLAASGAPSTARRRAAAVAKAYCGDAYASITGVGMQAHGGMGFTWEHDTHLYFKRAKLDQALFGDGPWHREQLAQAILTDQHH